jgi:hypothetical protein
MLDNYAYKYFTLNSVTWRDVLDKNYKNMKNRTTVLFAKGLYISIPIGLSVWLILAKVRCIYKYDNSNKLVYSTAPKKNIEKSCSCFDDFCLIFVKILITKISVYYEPFSF